MQDPYQADNGPDGTVPAKSPVMAGGLFASDTREFLRLGGFRTRQHVGKISSQRVAVAFARTCQALTLFSVVSTFMRACFFVPAGILQEPQPMTAE